MVATKPAAAGTIRLGDLTVNRMAFGAMRVVGLPDIWGEARSRRGQKKLSRRAIELGVNFVDVYAARYGEVIPEGLDLGCAPWQAVSQL